MYNFILKCIVKNIFGSQTMSVRASNNGKGKPQILEIFSWNDLYVTLLLKKTQVTKVAFSKLKSIYTIESICYTNTFKLCFQNRFLLNMFNLGDLHVYHPYFPSSMVKFPISDSIPQYKSTFMDNSSPNTSCVN